MRVFSLSRQAAVPPAMATPRVTRPRFGIMGDVQPETPTPFEQAMAAVGPRLTRVMTQRLKELEELMATPARSLEDRPVLHPETLLPQGFLDALSRLTLDREAGLDVANHHITELKVNIDPTHNTLLAAMLNRRAAPPTRMLNALERQIAVEPRLNDHFYGAIGQLRVIFERLNTLSVNGQRITLRPHAHRPASTPRMHQDQAAGLTGRRPLHPHELN